jgi:uncharacterized protein
MTQIKNAAIKQGWIRALLFMLAFVGLSLFVEMYASKLLEKWVPSLYKDGDLDLNNPLGLATMVGMSLFIALVLVSLFRHFVDGKTVASLGFPWKTEYALSGFFLGIVLLGLGTLFLVLNKNLQFIDLHFDAIQFTMGLLSMAVVAFSEELFVRGYVLNNLMQSVKPWIALLISASLFAILHAGNPNVTVLSLVNIFLAGILLGVNYIYTRNLWFGWLLHFSWNFFQGSVLGYNISGLTLQPVLTQEMKGADWLTGGQFGFEGSVVSAVLQLLAILILVFVYERNSKPVQAMETVIGEKTLA